MKKTYTKILIISLIALQAYAVNTIDSLIISGRILCDSTGLADVKIGDTYTNTEGYFQFKMPPETDLTLRPLLGAFVFTPEFFEISALDTSVDSLIFNAHRLPKKVIVIAGQSNAENVGEPRFFIPDSLDDHIPYYLAYGHGEFGLSSLGLLTKFGQTEAYIQEYNHGFGIEILLARTLYKYYSDSLAVMKIAYSGTTLNEDWQVDGRTYPRFLRMHDNASELFLNKGYDPNYIGFFWFQGVGDRSAERAPLYADNLDEFITRIRHRFPNDSAVDSLPFICVRTKWRETSLENMVRDAQMSMGEKRRQYAWIDIDDCDVLRYSETNKHFNGNALNRIGYKLALAYLDLIGEAIDSNTTIRMNLEGVKDTTLLVKVSGDTSFTQTIRFDNEFEFPAKIGHEYNIHIDQMDDPYFVSPLIHAIAFAYEPSVLYQPVYNFTIDEIVGAKDLFLPEYYELKQNYPNPFNPKTSLKYALPEVANIQLKIFDIRGRKVKEWYIPNQQPGWHIIYWYGRDMKGNILPSGVYIYSLQADKNSAGSTKNYFETKKMLFIK